MPVLTRLSEEEMNLKSEKVKHYWSDIPVTIDYTQMDHAIIEKFKGTHPKVVTDWLNDDTGLFQTDSKYKLSKKQRKHRLMIKLENFFNIELSKKHYKLIK